MPVSAFVRDKCVSVTTEEVGQYCETWTDTALIGCPELVCEGLAYDFEP